MATRFVSIDSSKFFAFLEQHGFQKDDTSSSEVVYSQSYADYIRLIVKVYTSVREGSDSGRGLGQDAIRVVAVYDHEDKSFGIYKGSRVYRTGSQEKVHSRVKERIEEAFDRCAEWKQQQQRMEVVFRSGNDKLSAFTVKHSANKFHIGAEVELTLTVVDRREWTGPHGARFIFTMKDEDERVFTYWTNFDTLQVNEMYDVHAKVKAHTMFRNVKQIELADMRGKRVIT